ncbi:hypothetical protein MP228_009573 [Amoeboaphelidium protococcarum]|nr:hypothetical protein MP228_009573 [Amoeboaphelidium protococcarum]
MVQSTVKVFVRARPLLQEEQPPQVVRLTQTSATVQIQSKRSALVMASPDNSAGMQKQFQFDLCIDSTNSQPSLVDCTQDELYQKVGPEVIDSAFAGYNSCVFAYGQSGSGKTYSITGTSLNPGIVPRVSQDLMQKIYDIRQKDPKSVITLHLTFMEIYNEKVRDLLFDQGSSTSSTSANDGNNDRHKKKGFKIREHPKTGPYVEGLTKVKVDSLQKLMELINSGNAVRAMASTRLNANSSRSHSLLTFYLHIQSSHLPNVVRKSQISIVDLAGSERSNVSETSNERLKEGGNINKSLSALGLVITALVERSKLISRNVPSAAVKKVFVPYRDSILTWLLKNSLGGNSKTIMIATVSSCSDHVEETLSTLRYATRAKAIVNRVVVNEDSSSRLIRGLQKEIEFLRNKLAQYESSQADRDKQAGSGAQQDGDDQDLRDLQNILNQHEQEKLAIQQHYELKMRSLVSDGDASSTVDNSVARKLSYNTDATDTSSRQIEYDTSKHAHIVSLLQSADGGGDDDDQLIYFLNRDGNNIGGDLDQDIILTGEDIEGHHAVIRYVARQPTSETDNQQNISQFSSDNQYSSWWIEPAVDQIVDSDILRNIPDIELNEPDVFPVYIDGQRITGPTPLKNGCHILFGRSHLFEFRQPQRERLQSDRSVGKRNGTFMTLHRSLYTGEGGSSTSSVTNSYYQYSESKLSSSYDDREESPHGGSVQIQDSAQGYESSVVVSAFDINEEERQFESAEGSRLEQSKPELVPQQQVQQPQQNVVQDFDSMLATHPEMFSNLVVDIPFIQKVQDDAQEVYYEFSISVTLSYHSTNSKTGMIDELPLTRRWIVQRRFKEIHAYFKLMKSRLPPVLAQAFPLPSLWEKMKELSDSQLEARRRRLEVFLNGLVGWWMEQRQLSEQSQNLCNNRSDRQMITRADVEQDLVLFNISVDVLELYQEYKERLQLDQHQVAEIRTKY